MRPVFVAGAQCLFDQQAAKTRTIEEQLAFDLRTTRELHGGDVARFPMHRHIDDLAFDALDAAFLAELAEKLRIQTGSEMECVGDLSQCVMLHLLGRAHGLVSARGDMIEAVVTENRRLTERVHALPVLFEANGPQVLADAPESVNVAVTDLSPVDEFDAQLE